MTKRFRFASLLLTATLGMAAAQTSTPTVQAVSDPALSKATVTFEIRRAGSDLTSLLVALAKSAGYEIIIETTADDVLKGNGSGTATTSAGSGVGLVSYNFANKPFNEVWPLVLDLYGLSYESLNIGGKTVLRVGVKPIQRIVKLPLSLAASVVERQLKLSFGTLIQVSNSQSAQQGSGSTASVNTTTATTRDDIILDSKTMRIVAEPASNSIIIRGTNQEVAQVQALLSQIIASQPLEAPAIVRVPTVQRIYTAQSSTADVTAVLAAQYPVLTVTPVGTSGRVVITGPQDQIEAALALLSQVDMASLPPAAAPNAMQQIYSVKGQQDDVYGVLAAQFPGLKVTPVGKTGQLIINGAQDQVTAALALLAQIDRATAAAPGTVQRIFQLVNASAEEVKATLEGTLARDLTLAAQTTGTAASSAATTGTTTASGTAGSAAGGAGSTVVTPGAVAASATIIADKRTNSLIIRGTADQVAQIAQLIPSLDERVPQINVQVRIQEITDSAAQSLGVNLTAGFGGFNVKTGASGLALTFDPTQSLVGFNLGATLNTLQTQGLSKSVYDGTITMQSGQRALGNGSGAQNASGGAAATIKSGGRLEITIPSASGNIEKQVDYGVNLDFTNPQVAPDGTISLSVRGQVNALQTPINASTPPNLLQFTNSEAQTSLIFKSGETLLLTGLMSNKESTSKEGVPFLSSIPVVGALFGSQTTRKEQTQLLVVITGNVIK